MSRFRLTILLMLLPLLSVTRLVAQAGEAVEFWLTSADRASLFEKQRSALSFTKQIPGASPTIQVSEEAHFQGIDGFGFALTGGSAELLMRMDAAKREVLLEELFGAGKGAIGISYLRVSIGASDMNERVFTYDDLKPGESDPELHQFSLGPDGADVIPVLKQVLAIAPEIRILATPWTAPAWMKTNGKFKAGSLRPEMYETYAHYLARYVNDMAAEGIRIDALTLQNEPLNENNTPSMHMTAAQEAAFLKRAVGPVFRRAGLKTKIVLYDHNCDKPEYPLSILADKEAAQYVDGTGFHLYGGKITAMSKVRNAYPDKHLYFTEQMVVQPEMNEPLRIAPPVSGIVIGAMRNWSRTVLLWNLAADPNNGPHTSDGGCPVCQGAVTIDGDKVTRNLAFYTIAHVARLVRPGSVRIGSEGGETNGLSHVAFRTPSGGKVLLVANTSAQAQRFRVRSNDAEFLATLAAGSVGTFAWQ